MERLAAHSTFEFRRVAAVGWISVVIGAGAIAIFGRGLPAWVAGCISIITATSGLYRLQKERVLLNDYELVVATVSQWTKTDSTHGGYSYSVRYRFLARDGKVYLGSGSTQRELPKEGETLPILYRRDDPSKNEALATFWFFRFTYTGTE
jgi:hypothetical protein